MSVKSVLFGGAGVGPCAQTSGPDPVPTPTRPVRTSGAPVRPLVPFDAGRTDEEGEVTDGRLERQLDAERGAAPAGGLGVGVANGESAAREVVDEIDLRALQIPHADRIDEQPHAVRLDRLIGVGGALALLDHQAVL